MTDAELAAHPTAVAIVGIAARFPGAPTLEGFWRNLCDGVESISFFGDEELIAAGVAPELAADPRYVKARGVLDDVDRFDAAFWNLTPREAEVMDPQHRVLLECAWEALERAGYDSERSAARVAVFAGAGLNSYLLSNLLPDRALLARVGELQALLLNNNDFLTTRISYKLGLRGPSALVQTACSTALVAIHMACQSLLGGECDMALAGGVSITVPQRTGYLHQEGGVMSPDGHCRAFDARAAGAVEGAGAGIVVLKRLADALADGDHVHAVIRGSATNNDGAARAGFTAPSVEGQAEVIAESLLLASVEPDTVGYVEAHGSGTPLGDPIEVAALTQAFRTRTARRGFCALGSVKTNVGHLNTAAGVAGLVKVALALEHGVLPPSLHFERPNPEIDFAASPFFVNAALRPWESAGPRRAGVSSFGLGGTNVHAVLEEAPAPAPGGPSRPRQLLLLAARSGPALAAAAGRLAAHLESHPEVDLADAAFTLAVGRRAFPHRRAVVCGDRDGAVAALGDPAGALSAVAPTAGGRPVAFLFPGLGDHYVDMARGLYGDEPAFRAEFDRCAELLAPSLGLDLRQVVFAGGEAERAASGPEAERDLRRLLRREPGGEDPAMRRLSRTLVAQPALFAVEYALARLLMSWGIHPEAMIGYSIGEYVAACLAGVLSLPDALSLVAARARMIEALPAGAMLAVPLPEEDVRPLLAADSGLAAINGPHFCVVGGAPEAIADLERRLAGVACLRLHATHAFHTELLRPACDELVRLAESVALHPPAIPYLSNVTGTWITAEQATDPRYWAAHMVGTVRFAEGLGELLGAPERVLLEVGPGGTLGTLARQHPAAASGRTVLSALRHASEESADSAHLLSALGRLWLAGVTVDWSAFYAGERRRRVPLPTYPFERQRYWIDPPARDPAATGTAASEPPRNRERVEDWFYQPAWREAPTAALLSAGDPADGPWLAFLDGLGLGEQLVARLRGAGRKVVTVLPGAAFAAAGEDGFVVAPGGRDGYVRLLQELRGSGRFPARVLHLWSVGALAPGAGFEAVQERGLLSLLGLVHALGELAHADPVRIAAVASGLFAVGDGERAEPTEPEKAPLAGLCRLIPQEHPQLACRLIDVALPAAPGGLEAIAAALWTELAGDAASGSPSPAPAVALRGRRRWERGYEPVVLPPAAAGASRLREGGVYVVTDAAHGIGLALAEELHRTLAARLVIGKPAAAPAASSALASGAAAPPGWAERWAALSRAEGVLIADLDLASAAGARAALDLARQRFGAVHGVFHTAAEFAGGLLQLKTRAALPAVFGAPVQGAFAWMAVVADDALDFLLLAGSTAAVTGGFGQLDPCAAGCVLGALAERGAGAAGATHVVAVDWDPYQWDCWLAGGVAAAAHGIGGDPGDLAAFGVASARSMEALRRLLATALPRVVVSAQDLPAVIAATDAFHAAELLAQVGRAGGGGSGPGAARDAAAGPYVAPREGIEEKLAAIWQELFGIERIGVEDNFLALGGHSLLAIQLATQIRSLLGVELPVSTLFEHPTIADLARVVERESGAIAEPSEEDLDRLLAEVEELSAEELARLLAEERQERAGQSAQTAHRAEAAP